jgi:hypothetical protein
MVSTLDFRDKIFFTSAISDVLPLPENPEKEIFIMLKL